MTFRVYVTGDGNVREVVGLNPTGGLNVAFTSHRRTVGASLSIALPDAGLIVARPTADEPAGGTPGDVSVALGSLTGTTIDP